MPSRIFAHFRGNAVAYVALFVALGGSSYAAVSLSPGSVHSSALAKGAVTHSKLAPGSVRSRALARGAVTKTKLAKNSVTSASIVNGSLTSKDFKAGAIINGLKGSDGSAGSAGLDGSDGIGGSDGIDGSGGADGASGPVGPAGHDGSASLGTKVRLASPVTAPHGATTAVPLSSAAWTQSAGELDMVAGSVTMQTPASCTGSFGNSLLISIDGKTNTFAVAPALPASSTVTVPFLVGTMSEPDNDQQHTATAQFASTCTKSGEDYTVNDLKLDVVKFR
jgi:hypothetical protein